ncbi:hypothetical protein PHK61_31730, partial [Actinomycetospora lutea]|uniref:hypothetical protein n=1 Tax=Actinomycetospora lutea TaxID=663604 RepID=UPI002366E63D
MSDDEAVAGVSERAAAADGWKSGDIAVVDAGEDPSVGERRALDEACRLLKVELVLVVRLGVSLSVGSGEDGV